MASPGELRDRALSAHRAERYAEAETCYRELLSLQAHPAVLSNLGLVLAAQRRHAEAIDCFEQSIHARPGDANTRVALANALIFSNRPGEALACCDTVIADDPGNIDARHNRAVALRALNRHAEAIEQLESILAIDPADADAEFNLALSELTLGHFEAGWRHYEARWRGLRANPAPPLPAIARWHPGDILEGRSVILQAEQGLGDTLHFIRWAPLAARACAHLEIQVHASLLALVRRHFPGQVVSVLGDAPSRPIDLRLPLMSLPLSLGLDEAALFAAGRYLAPGHRVATWRERLPGGTRRWAFAWRGNFAHRHDFQRSLPLAKWRAFIEAAGVAGIELLAVQKDVTVAERASLECHPHVRILDAELADFEETAAVLALVEQLVCVDTAVAHLAGAMEVPTTVLLAFSPDFRWGTEGTASRFYPSLRLARQRSPAAWDDVLESIVGEIS